MDKFVLPYDVQGAIWRTPKAPYQPRREDYKNSPKPFGNPEHPGYGGGEWPFDKQRAYTDVNYRNGIRKAIGASWPDGFWKFVAQKTLVLVLDDLVAQAEFAQQLDEEQMQ